MNAAPTSPRLQRYAWLSIATAVATIGLKTVAWRLTGSVGMLSDALESGVNLAAAVVALAVLTVAARPPDARFEHGYDKSEYFSSGLEGGLIVVAAIMIGASAVQRFLHPAPVEHVGLGLAVSVLASVLNGVVAAVLLRAGKKHGSIVLDADGRHLLTDVWTSAGVIVAVGVVGITGLAWLDPWIAILVAVNILVTGFKLVRRSMRGLLDPALAEEDRAKITTLLDQFVAEGVSWHALRTRQSASRRFLTVHLLVPGAWSVQRGHDLVERVEAAIHAALSRITITTHLEPLEDPASHGDEALG